MGLMKSLFGDREPNGWAEALPLMDTYRQAKRHPQEDYVVIAMETSGLNPRSHEILELAGIHYHQHLEAGRFESLVRPRGWIPSEASKIHGLRWKDVKNAPDLDEVKPKFLEFIQDYTLVGWNVEFCVLFLQTRFQMELVNPAYDAMLAFKQEYPWKLYGFSLPEVCRFLSIPMETHHRAMADCENIRKVFHTSLRIAL